MVEGATTGCLVSVYDRRAPPEIGTKEARLVDSGPNFIGIIAPANHQMGGCIECNTRKIFSV